MGFMRCPRITVEKGEDGLYHCMSRIVGGDFIFDKVEKEVFIQRMWRLAEFLGIAVLDYVVMSNHYHQLLGVPGLVEISDAELLRRVQVYYGENSREAKILEKALEKGGDPAQRQRKQYRKRMGNLSEYQKHLKQGFTKWYNRQRKRKGTLWMERFKSVLVEDAAEARQVVASYIDLNPVRAEMVDDPKNYRHCGYAAALAGDERCRAGLKRIMECGDWESAAAQYRIQMMIQGSREIHGKRGSISRELLLETLQKYGHLPRAQLLRLKVRYLTDGLVIGSEQFVEKLFHQYRSHFGEKRKSGARPVKGLSSGGLSVIRDLRNAVFE